MGKGAVFIGMLNGLTWTVLSFIKNDIMKQKRTAAGIRVRRNLK
jgi:hypothetical protein